ncbi:WhiB family transcriptional regulator [Nocardiopsis sp. YSL2]|uniref:WhiB family transcriptional regulator n=1 Tax=Nocardiopsis sp. YSL2 TaxID=2939492 RepID=UPI0026F42853|nr:WhiB family transcriptional regulator [Nocardiopsis sp. YSL2]
MRDLRDQAWRDDAACKNLPLWVFFGAPGERGDQRERREEKAKTVCADCPVRVECLDEALEGSPTELCGVRGGLNGDEQRAVRRRRIRAARARAAA